ncbi:MAG: NUDIX domain-containing protein [Planctomycetia bacterium]|nr:NUDIX domain-containing protein [Planctomycetia bacterium]NDH94747.1 NUDIX domain-containing protein [Planctomycetia bacterium]
MSDPVAIAVVLVIHEHRALVGRRPLTAFSAAGYAEFPGGKIEPAETAAAAAQRECREETGLEIEVEGLIASDRVADTDSRIDFFSGRLARPACTVPRPPFTWLTAEEITACRFPPANTTAIQWLLRKLS